MHSGACGEGFTMGQPTAMAGATLCSTRFSGKLEWAKIAAMTPIGKRL